MKYADFERAWPTYLSQVNPSTRRSWKRRGEVPDQEVAKLCGTTRFDKESLSARDWFAGQALAGLLASAEQVIALGRTAADLGLMPGKFTAALAYEYADDMIAERDGVKK